VDSIGSFEAALARAKEKGKQRMDSATLRDKHPEVFEEVFKMGASSVEVDFLVSTAFEQAVAKERERVVSILDADGDREATLAAIKEGVSADSAFKSFYLAEKAKREKGIETLETESPEPVGVVGKPKTEEPRAEEFLALVEKHQADTRCTRTQALQAMTAKHPELYQAWIDSRNAGKK
jgi:hypothetical protein